jgi:hypothetical protein
MAALRSTIPANNAITDFFNANTSDEHSGWSVHSVSSTLLKFFPWVKVDLFDSQGQVSVSWSADSTIPPQTVYTK